MTSIRIICCFIIVSFAAWTLSAFFAAQQAWAESWGQRPYYEELEQYKAQKIKLERQIHQLSAKIAGIGHQLKSFMGSWSQKDRLKALRWFENEYANARAFKTRYRTSKSEYHKAANDYAKLKNQFYSIDITDEALVNRHARDMLWSAELEMLRLRVVALQDELRYRDLELYAIKAYEDIYWTGFVYDTLDDMQYILNDYADNLTNELYDCFLNTATKYAKHKMLKRPVPSMGVGFGTISRTGEVYACAKGITLNSIVNALEAATRKQFVDSMEDRGIEPSVAEFWWANYVMPKAAKQTRTEKAFKRFLTAKFWKGQVKEEATNYLKHRLYKDIKGKLVKRLKNLASEERYGDNARKLVENVSKERVDKHVSVQFLEMTEFGIKYGERAAILYYNQAGFEEIASDLISKRQMIKQCLRKKKRPDHAAAIISVFKYSQQGWREFIRDCKEADSRQDLGKTGGRPSTLNECETSASKICGVWKLKNGSYHAKWENGATAIINVSQFGEKNVVFTRNDKDGVSKGLRANYVGTRTGNCIEGKVTWTYNKRTWTGTWTANW